MNQLTLILIAPFIIFAALLLAAFLLDQLIQPASEQSRHDFEDADLMRGKK